MSETWLRMLTDDEFAEVHQGNNGRMQSAAYCGRLSPDLQVLMQVDSEADAAPSCYRSSYAKEFPFRESRHQRLTTHISLCYPAAWEQSLGLPGCGVDSSHMLPNTP